MIFKCKNCGGNVVYSPERHTMYCPYCDAENSGEREDGNTEALTICPNCGGEVQVELHTSATQCPYCDCHLIFDERVEGRYQPQKIIPFQMGKENCKKSIREKFKKCLFAPIDFLSEVRLNSMQGIYVPYWFYDYDTWCEFLGEGTKVRVWRSGNTEYRETSFYQIHRELEIAFRNIPVDASVQMPDQVMDLMAPFDYSQLTDFVPEYMSGFYGEKYNMEAVEVEERAGSRMGQDAGRMLVESYAGYNTVRSQRQDIRVNHREVAFCLLPIWRYLYTYKGKEYPFYVNGQTGKIVGAAPLDKGRVWAYAGTFGSCVMATLLLLLLLTSWL